jgi:hypothetical protein
MLKMIILPRQARDKHRDSTQKETRFSQVWKGLPWPAAMLCTSCGGGAQLTDGSYVYLVVTQFNRTWISGDHSKEAPCCNNSVVAFTSPDALTWTYSATVGAYDERRCARNTQRRSLFAMPFSDKKETTMICQDRLGTI